MNLRKGEIELKIPSRRSFVRLIQAVHANDINEIKTILASVQYVCTTADIWTYGHRRVIGETACWVRDNLLKLFKLIYFFQFPTRFKMFRSLKSLKFLFEMLIYFNI